MAILCQYCTVNIRYFLHDIPTLGFIAYDIPRHISVASIDEMQYCSTFVITWLQVTSLTTEI